MQPENTAVTVRELYQLVDQKMDQVNKSIIRVETKFDDLAGGRLSKVESDVANIQGRAMMIPMIITIGMNMFFFILTYLLGKK